MAFFGKGAAGDKKVKIAVAMLVSAAAAVFALFARVVYAITRDPRTQIDELSAKVLFDSGVALEQGCDLTLVIPYYNPGDALTKHISELNEILDSSELRYEIIAVSDGSTDGSTEAITGLYPSVLRNIELSRNYGKGHAVRVGLAQGQGSYLGFIDADGDIPALQLVPVLDQIKKSQPEIITGSKRHLDSEVYYPPLRRFYSWGYQQLIRILFRLSVSDTQTGMKFVRRDVLEKTLPLMVEKRFAFDLELFVVARKLGYSEIVEVPVVIQQRFTSTVSPKAAIGIMLDTLGIFYRLHILKYYDHPTSGCASEQKFDAG